MKIQVKVNMGLYLSILWYLGAPCMLNPSYNKGEESVRTGIMARNKEVNAHH